MKDIGRMFQEASERTESMLDLDLRDKSLACREVWMVDIKKIQTGEKWIFCQQEVPMTLL